MATLNLFRYPGGKSKLIKILMDYIEPLLNDSNVYSEPFIGGGSIGIYIAEKYPKIQLFFNDKDVWISSFWKVISDNNKVKNLLEMLEHPATIEHFYKLNEMPILNDIDMAYRAIFYNRCCFSGIVKRDKNNKVKSSPIGGKNQKSKYTVSCRYNSKKIKENIIYCNKLLSGRVVVDNMDVYDYLHKMHEHIPMYLDPPYWNKSDQLYNEYMSSEEHSKLATLLQNRFNWILSYDNDPEIKNLYQNNKIIDLPARYSITGTKQTWQNKIELIILP